MATIRGKAFTVYLLILMLKQNPRRHLLLGFKGRAKNNNGTVVADNFCAMAGASPTMGVGDLHALYFVILSIRQVPLPSYFDGESTSPVRGLP